MYVFEKLILMITSTYFHHYFPFNFFGVHGLAVKKIEVKSWIF